MKKEIIFLTVFMNMQIPFVYVTKIEISKVVDTSRPSKNLNFFNPQGLWGIESIGLSPSALASFRSRVASAAATGASQRCTTTAIHLAYGDGPAILHDAATSLRACRRWIKSMWIVWDRQVEDEG